MQGDSHSNTDLVKDSRRFPLLPFAQPAQQIEQDEEGGLNLGQVVSALRRRIPIILGVTTVVTSAAVLRAITSTPTYQSSFELLTRPVTAESQVISSVPQTLSNKEQGESSEKALDVTKLKLLSSPKLLDPIVKELKLKYKDITYDELAANLKVSPLPSSEILSVSYQDKNPEKVKDILKLTSEAYVSYSLEERLSDVKQGIEFVDDQVSQLRDRVDQIQDQLQTFRQQFNLIDPDSTSKQLAEQSSSISQQRLDAQVKLNEARALYTDLTRELSQEPGESAAATALRDNPRYQELLGKLLEVKSQIAKESSLYREDTAEIRVLRDQQRNLLDILQQEGQQVREELASKIRDLEARNQILSQAETQLNQNVKQLSVVSRRYTDIQRELKIATENLDQFLAKREALRIDASQRKAPWQVLASPTEPIPSAASARRSAMLGAILGLLMGAGAALLLDKLSNILRTPEEIKDVSRLPVLGVIPFNKELIELENLKSEGKLGSIADVLEVVQQVRQQFSFSGNSKAPSYTTSPFLEAFRSLYANILLLNSDIRIQSFVISSSSPGEGKSTVSIHLAYAAAALGKRVLLIDADLRLPQLHKRLELANVFGLSNLIASDLDVESVIQPSLVDNNLSILTAGQIPPDPTKLLSSQKMQKLMDQFKQTYDLVIYDTPPLLGLADAKLLAAKTDGVVMVVGLDKTKGSVLTQALDSLKAFQVPILGVVANGSKESIKTYDFYDRYYRTGAEAESSPDGKDSVLQKSKRL